jgi:hypothetical protein
MVVTTVLGAVLFELLEHYASWSFIPQIAVPLAAVALDQYLAARQLKPLKTR